MKEKDSTDQTLLAHIPVLINDKENADIREIPNTEEVKNTVFQLNGDSLGAPYGLTCKFYQCC